MSTTDQHEVDATAQAIPHTTTGTARERLAKELRALLASVRQLAEDSDRRREAIARVRTLPTRLRETWRGIPGAARPRLAILLVVPLLVALLLSRHGGGPPDYTGTWTVVSSGYDSPVGARYSQVSFYKDHTADIPGLHSSTLNYSEAGDGSVSVSGLGFTLTWGMHLSDDNKHLTMTRGGDVAELTRGGGW